MGLRSTDTDKECALVAEMELLSTLGRRIASSTEGGVDMRKFDTLDLSARYETIHKHYVEQSGRQAGPPAPSGDSVSLDTPEESSPSPECSESYTDPTGTRAPVDALPTAEPSRGTAHHPQSCTVPAVLQLCTSIARAHVISDM
jgi:hypothetical protein